MGRLTGLGSAPKVFGHTAHALSSYSFKEHVMVLPGQPQSLIPALHIPAGSDCPSHLLTAYHQICDNKNLF